MTRCVALIVAAGRGLRLGHDLPKQYLPLAGVSLLRHSIETCLAHPRIDAVRCVIHPDDADLYAAAVAGLELLSPVAGGAQRQDSVRLGLESLEPIGPDAVLIHDAARPFLSPDLITHTLDALGGADGAIAAVPVHDTLKRGQDGCSMATVDRSGLWRAQTPQSFRFRAILGAHRSAIGQQLTDDAAVAERAGLRVALIPGSEDNIKITTPQDFDRAERLLAARHAVRVGIGFDVHRFGPGNQVVLGGLAIPHERALIGHSDADVALHAITDALLGAIAAGDIGEHFPPSDPQWRGADSAVFLRHAAELVRARGGVVQSIDLTIICERPKIGPHRAAMVERIGTIAGIATHRINVKATTTEGLGFTGRREGIAAQAVAAVLTPTDG